VNDGADTSLRKTVSLLNKIEAKTGSATITGPVTVTNEVEIKNDANNPLPVSDNNGSLTVDGTVELGSTSLAALENISVTFPATQNVNVTNAGLSVSVSNLPATQPVSLASAPVTPVTDNGGSLTVDGTVTINDMTSGNAKTKIVDSVGADVSYITAGTAGTPSAGVLSVQGINGGVSLPISGSVETGLAQPLTDTQLRALAVPVSLASAPVTPVTDNDGSLTVDGSVSVSNFPATQSVSGSISVSNFPATQPVSLATAPTTPVTGTFWQATQPTRETQPTNDYAINTIALATLSLSGSAVQSASFDAGANADYVVISITGGGSSGALYYDLSTNNSTWDAGNTSGGFATYYDIPATSTTDAYSYKSVGATSFFGATRSGYSARLIVPLQQSQPGSGTQLLYRYIRLNAPASNGGWRYKFTSYKSVDPLLAFSVPGNPSTTRVTGRVDVGYVSNLPALPTGTNTIGSVNVLGGNATAVKVDGSAVTQPVSGTVNTYPQQGTTATNTNFSSITSAELAPAVANRESLTVYNEGPGTLFVNVGGSCSTTSYQVRLFAGDYWEAPAGQLSLQHSGIFGTAGTARALQVS